MENSMAKRLLYASPLLMRCGRITLMVLSLPLALFLFVLITLAFGAASILTSILLIIKDLLKE